MPLAEFGDFIYALIPITALLIPIVAILVSHQQKMATIIHSGQQNNRSGEIDELRREVRELKELVHQQTLAIDNVRQAPPPESVSRRLEV